MKIKMYRQTVRHREHLPDGTYVDFYRQTDWSSVSSYIPGPDKAIVKTEIKEIEVSESCLRRKCNKEK